MIVTAVPAPPLVGLKLVIVGVGPAIVKLVVLVAVPLGVVTVIGPLAAPAGTVVLIWVGGGDGEGGAGAVEGDGGCAAEVGAGDRDGCSGAPLVGLKLVIVGVGPVTVKLPPLPAAGAT